MILVLLQDDRPVTRQVLDSGVLVLVLQYQSTVTNPNCTPYTKMMHSVQVLIDVLIALHICIITL